MKRKIFLLICAVLIAALLIGVLVACDPGSKDQGGSQTSGGTQLPGNGGGGGTQTPGDNDQDDEQGGEVIEPAKLIFEKTDAGYSVTGYEGTPTVVVIPDTHEGLPVTSIGGSAFSGCTSLTSITIPDSVTSIGGSAFSGCDSLASVTIPDSVTSIGDYAFAYCTFLASVTIPDSVTSIGSFTFYICTSLTSLTIPDSVTSIGSGAFWGCYKLIEVYNKSSLDITAGSTANGYVGGYAKHVYTEEDGSWLTDTEDGFRFFYDGETGYLVAYLGDETELTLPDSFTAYDGTEVTSYQIYYYAFLNTHRMLHELIGSNASMSHPSSLTSVTIGNSVTSIGMYAFGYCDSLTSVTIPDSVKSIGDGAFLYCDTLTSITIPDSVASIGGGAFEGCTSLERLTVAPGNPVYRSAGNCIIETETGTLIQGCNNSVIPSDGSVTSIGDYAFYYCDSLTSITIPDSVTSIGDSAFRNCDALTSITIPNSVTSIGEYAFAYCDSLTSITIPDSVASIGSAAFRECTSLTSVTIGDSVTSIGSSAFSGCDRLVEVYNKSSLGITVGSSSYGYVGYYAKHVYTEENDSWLTDTENGFRFLYDGETGYLVAYLGNETELTLPESFIAHDGTEVTSYQIYDYAFYGRNDLTSVTIGTSVIDIGRYAFQNCSAEIVWGDAPVITEIGDYAFADYAGTNITIPDSVTSIGDSAFRGCTSLTSITIPDSVTSIELAAFAYCSSLERLTVAPGNPVYRSTGNCIIETETGTLIQGCNNSVIPTDGSVTSIGSYAFSGCGSLTSITIPDSVTSIGAYAFYSCDSLTSIVIPDSVTSIGEDAFAWCTSLTAITIPDSVTSIGGSAFYNCTSLTSITIGNGVTSIGDYAFSDCTSLTSVTIPDSVTSIGGNAFYWCDALEAVRFEGTVAEWNSVDKGSSWKYNCPFTAVECGGGLTMYKTPEGSNTISGRAKAHAG